MTPHDLADTIEARLNAKRGVSGLGLRDLHLIDRQEAVKIVEWLRTIGTAAAFVGEKR